MTGDNTNESDFERQPRESLHRDAERINPRDRRTEILAMVHDDTQVAQPARRRLIPLAAAASLAPIGAIIWGVSNTGGGQPVGQLVTPAAPTTSSSPSSSPSSPSSSAAAGTTSQVALPAYFVGASSGKEDRFGLHREFVRTAVPVGATPPQKAQAAVAVVMNAQPFTNDEPYVQPWSGQSVKDVTMTPSLITITLSGSSVSGFTKEQTRLAVQELVWTAQIHGPWTSVFPPLATTPSGCTRSACRTARASSRRRQSP